VGGGKRINLKVQSRGGREQKQSNRIRKREREARLKELDM
jgi:hypothetical protein